METKYVHCVFERRHKVRGSGEVLQITFIFSVALGSDAVSCILNWFDGSDVVDMVKALNLDHPTNVEQAATW